MAKKKKSIASTQTQQVAGNVTISIISNDKKIRTIKTHNIGTLNLFYGIIASLSGNPAVQYLPNYVSMGDGRSVSGDNPVTFNSLKHETLRFRVALVKNYSGPTINNSTVFNCSTIYQGIIPYDPQANTITELGIFGTYNTNTLLARVELENSFEVQQGQSVLVQWEFVIQNTTITDASTVETVEPYIN